MRLLFGRTGFDIVHIGGGTARNRGRRPVELDEFASIVIGVKRETVTTSNGNR